MVKIDELVFNLHQHGAPRDPRLKLQSEPVDASRVSVKRGHACWSMYSLLDSLPGRSR